MSTIIESEKNDNKRKSTSPSGQPMKKAKIVEEEEVEKNRLKASLEEDIEHFKREHQKNKETVRKLQKIFKSTVENLDFASKKKDEKIKELESRLRLKDSEVQSLRENLKKETVNTQELIRQVQGLRKLNQSNEKYKSYLDKAGSISKFLESLAGVIVKSFQLNPELVKKFSLQPLMEFDLSEEELESCRLCELINGAYSLEFVILENIDITSDDYGVSYYPIRFLKNKKAISFPTEIPEMFREPIDMSKSDIYKTITNLHVIMHELTI